jgi:hypothetical protein
MASDAASESTPHPKQPIRRFDVFAEYQRLKGLQKGMDEPHAKGYGLWLAKVVASGGRKSSRTRGQHGEEDETADQADKASHEQEWHELSGVPQTDALFDREIVRRMGPQFYARVFAPAIVEAERQGGSYESIRDTLRKQWKPMRP